jgi:hypothetical protein
VIETDAGLYQVRVQNAAGTVWSLPARLRVGQAVPGGGLLFFANRRLCNNPVLDVPIFNVDGGTPLTAPGYLAQLYAGPSVAMLRPAGHPVSFFIPGFVPSKVVTLANVPPGSNAVVQVRAWDAAKGDTYEEARALGGSFGKSDLLSLMVGGGNLPAQCLAGLRSFSLQTGLPEFTVGTVQFVEHRPPDTLVWAVTGQAGSRYLVEKAGNDFVWQPYVVITNATGTVTFTDSASNSPVSVYRARILD